MNRELLSRIEQALSCRVVGQSPVRGGDINDAYRLELNDGERVFVKTQSNPPPHLFECEARGLDWLRVGPLRVPEVLYVDSQCLVLEWIERGRPDSRSEARLGEGLAELHLRAAPNFGLSESNYLATIALDNRPTRDWPTFYRERRLEPLLRMASERGLASGEMKRGIERLYSSDSIFGNPSAIAHRLHGDLWGGNCFYDASGAPVLIDPAAYGGDREVDWAMMQLFGGFSERVFAAYQHTSPLESDYEIRVPLYQLLPLLAHVVLFGRSYVGAVEGALRRLGVL